MSRVGGRLQQHPRLRLPTVARSGEGGVDRVRVVQAVAVIVDHDSLFGKQSNDVLVRLAKVLVRGLALGRAWLVRDNDGTVVERADTTDRVGRSRDEPHVVLDIRALERLVHGVPDELDDDTVPVEENRAIAQLPSAASTDSHFPGAVTSAGCETRRCHTIAWNSST